jgi:hypothetical protein
MIFLLMTWYRLCRVCFSNSFCFLTDSFYLQLHIIVTKNQAHYCSQDIPLLSESFSFAFILRSPACRQAGLAEEDKLCWAPSFAKASEGKEKTPQSLAGSVFQPIRCINYWTALHAPLTRSSPTGLNPFIVSICAFLRCMFIFLLCKDETIFLI